MRMRMLAGRSVAAIGLGDVSFARATLRNHDPAEIIRRVHDALELSIDVIDVADEPDALRAVGDAIRSLRARDRAIAITTVRLPDLRAIAFVQEQIEANLRTSKLDVLPLVQLPLRAAHLAHIAWPELLFALERIAREGKVAAWGIAVDRDDVGEARDAGDARDTDEPPPDPLGLAGFTTTSSGLFVPSVAPPSTTPKADTQLAHPLALPLAASLAIDLSICDRAFEPVLAARSSHAILAHRPLAGGALAGRLGTGAVLARADDRRDADADAIAIAVAKLSRLVRNPPPAARSTEAARAITETAKRPDHVECATIAELALRFVIDRGAIALPRIVRRDDLIEAIAAGSAPALSAGYLNIDPVPSQE
jgi:aryl-alcohol dehydrogenase-like predicted oxidoreductase